MEPFNLKPAQDLGLTHQERTLSLRRECGLVETALHVGYWSAMRGYLRLFHRLKVVGAEHLPAEPPYVVIANHSSHLDALALASILPMRHRDRIFPLAAGDYFFETPVTATMAAWCINALPLWRHNCGRHALGELRKRLIEEPCIYILFPAGTRSEDGLLLPFKEGLGMMIAGTDVPVVPCALKGAFECWPKGRRWPRPGEVTVRLGEPLRFADQRNRREGWRTIAQRSYDAVAALMCHETSPVRTGLG